jgi:hypothetical protein
MRRRVPYDLTGENAAPPSGRHRRTTSRLVARRPRAARFATVWPCAQDDLRTGTGFLADWLLTAIIKVVATYSTPGARILLLIPAGPSPTVTFRRSGQYTGLAEAVWAIARLGRSVQTAIINPDDRSLPKPQPTAGLFDVVITAAEPRTLLSMRPTAWRPLLTPRGVFAAITHTDHSGQRLLDPAGALVRAGHEDGLRYLDHIALLRMPISHSALDNDRRPAGPSAPRLRVHADLHVFGANGGAR